MEEYDDYDPERDDPNYGDEFWEQIIHMLEMIRPEPDKFFFQYQPHNVRDIVEDKELAADAEAYIKATGQDSIFDETMPIIARKKMARKTLDNIAMRLYDTRATIGLYVNQLKRNRALKL